MAVEPKKSKKQTDDKNVGGQNSNIILNPELKEASAKTVVVSFGRMNPPTIGHEKLVNKVKELAKRAGGVAQVYLSHSQDAKKNPLSYDDKIMLAKEAFGSIIQKAPAKTLIDVMKSLTGHFDNVMFVAGADRVQEFDALLKKYNGKEYNFKSIEVVSAGERDPDAEGVEGMSASKMREAASKGDVAKFKSGLPKNLQKHTDEVYSLVRGGMKLAEEAELEEHVLSVSERMKRAITARRLEKKMEMSRERLRTRIADQKHLEGRARKKAIQIVRKKVAGEKGLEYASLSPAEKIMIDKRVEERKKSIAKIAARLLPTVRKAEFARVALLSKGGQGGTGKQVAGQPNSHINESFEAFLEEGIKPRYHMVFDKHNKAKLDRRFRAFRNIIHHEQTDAELLNVIQEAFDESPEDIKIAMALIEKSQKSGLDFDIVFEAFIEGMYNLSESKTQEQAGFDNVNALVTNHINEAFEIALNEGVHDPAIFKAVFLAGGPGSGKSFIVGRTALTALGMKVINSDDAFERALAKAGMASTPENIYSPKGQEIRDRAKALTGKLMDHAVHGRLGLVIDGTGKDFGKIEKQAEKLKKIGYDVAMIFVNTSLDTAKTRNKMRARSLPDSEVETMWSEVQHNIGKFQQYFGNNMFIIDNTAGQDVEPAILSAYRKISAWAKSTPKSPAAKSWIASHGHLGEAVVVPGPALGRSTVKDMHQQQIPAPVIPPAPKDVNTKAEVDAHIERHLRAVTSRDQKMKKFRTYHEEYGAGFEATDKLVKNYKAATPGEKGVVSKPKITDGVNEAFEAMMEAEGSVKRNRELLATGRISKDEFDRRMGYGKYKPKGPAGVGPLGKSLYKNLVKTHEEVSLSEEAADDSEISAAQMKDFEKFVDRMFEKYKIDFEFTKHFGERMNDDRNSPKIKLKELADLIKKIYAKHGNPLKDKPGAEMVVKDLQSDLNMPVVVKYDPKNDEIDIVAKTIMRKKNFSTPNPVVKY